MKAGKLNVDQVNFLGVSLNAYDKQRMREIEEEFEYELSPDYPDYEDEENEDEDDTFVEDIDSDESSSH